MIVVKFNVLYIIFIVVLVGITVLLVLKQNIKTKVKILRIILVVLLIMFLLRIEYKVRKTADKINLIILVDTSYSMKFNDRLNKVKQFLQQYYYQLSKKYIVEIYKFDEELNKVDNVSDIVFSQKGTEIHNALDKILLQLKLPSVVLVFSDGINKVRSLPTIKNDKASVIPVTFHEPNFKDVSIIDVKYSKIGFKDIEYEFKVKILSVGYDDINSVVRLTDLDTKRVIKEESVKIKKGENEFKLSFTPKIVGKQRLKLEIQRLPEEVTYENNYENIDIEVRKNKIRVLYLCGQPSFEYFHLRNLLKNDPSIELVSFVILRNPEDVVIVPDEDLALIPFPVYDIFVKELFNYDLVIFENFTYRKFGITMQHLENLRQFVLSGGGFIMIGGTNSFYLGGYKYTPVEDLLPVVMSDREEMVYLEFRPEVISYDNPLLKVFDDEKENKVVWSNIPFLGNYQKVAGVKDNTVVLLKYRDTPIVCYTTQTKGKVFAIMTNTTWRWALGNILDEKYDFRKLYTEFWKNIIYFASGAKEMKNIFVICADQYCTGETMDIYITTNVEFKFAQPEVYITLPDRTKKYLSVKKISDNRYYTVYQPSIEGKHVITAVISEKTKGVFKDEKEVDVRTAPYTEIAVLKPDIEYMQSLSDMYGQKVEYINTMDINKTIELASKNILQEYKNVISIYNNPITGIFFVFLFMLEIYFARYRR